MRFRIFYVAFALGMVVVGIVAALALNGVQEMAADLEQTKADNAKINADLTEQKAASSALAEQVERLGGKPVVDPPTTPPAQGERGPGPTDAQVRSAVAVICAGSRSACSPTAAQVKVAVAAICAGGECRGRDGKDAETPEDGQDGQDGRDATDEQVDAAVERYCAEDGCRGPGPTDAQIDERLAAYCADGHCRGTDGTNGKDGVSITDVACDRGTGSFTFTFSDGSTRTVECTPLEN